MVGDFLDKLFFRWWVILLALMIPAIWALLLPGYFGASDDLHIAWLYEMDKTLRIPQIPPRFVPDLSFGFGYPLFNFVFPLPFYIAEVFHLSGFSLVDSIKAVFLVATVVSGFAMFFLLREFLNNSLSLAGAVVYTYTPYRAVDLYIRGAIGEITAFAFLPLITLSVLKILFADKTSWRWIGLGGFSIGGLILSHNITAFMFFPLAFLLIVIGLILKVGNFKRILVNNFLMIILGLLVSIYFWLPAVVDSKLMKYDTIFNFVDHFPTLSQLITPYWGYGASVPGPFDGMSFFLGLINIFLIIGGIYLALRFKSHLNLREKTLFIWALLSFFLAVFFMNHRSSIFWSSLPLLPYFQFPWRFLIIVTFITPIFLIGFQKLNKGNLLSLGIIIVTVLLSFNYFRPEDFLGRVDEYYLNRYIPYPVASEEYYKIQEEYLRLPKETDRRPEKNYPLVKVGDDDLDDIEIVNSLSFRFPLNINSPELININKYNFPGWIALVDGKEVDIGSGKPFGQISFQVSSGAHEIEVFFKETGFRKILNFISLVSFLILITLFLLGDKKKINVSFKHD